MRHGLIPYQCAPPTAGARTDVARPAGTGASCEEMSRMVYSFYGSRCHLREFDDKNRLRRELLGQDVDDYLTAEAEGRS